MHELAAARNIRFLVVVIPTKETVFHELWQTPSASYRKLIENEKHFRKITREFFERAGIEHLDALPALQEHLAAGVQPFFVSQDGHLNERGQQAIAKLVAAHLKSRKTSPAELREGAAARRHADRYNALIQGRPRRLSSGPVTTSRHLPN
jgi:hypothetical protein